MNVRADNISMKYLRKRGESNYFYGVAPQNFELKEGEVTVVMGRSGSGKTTLLNILSGLVPPTEGHVYHGDTDLYAMNEKELSIWRGTKLGIVPQGRSLLDSFTMLENILLPYTLHPQPDRDDADLREKALELMQHLEIEQLKDTRPPALSGGEIRRAAIVRALLGEPALIFADEPTGDLDDVSTRQVLELFRAQAERGAAVLLVTHEQEALRYADRSYTMNAGRLE